MRRGQRRRPREGRYATCEYCGAPIMWAFTAAGNRQSLNPEPDPAGNVLAWRDGTGTWRARSVASTREIPAYGHERTHMPHAATCTGPRQTQMRVPPAADNVIPLQKKKGRGRR